MKNEGRSILVLHTIQCTNQDIPRVPYPMEDKGFKKYSIDCQTKCKKDKLTIKKIFTSSDWKNYTFSLKINIFLP